MHDNPLSPALWAVRLNFQHPLSGDAAEKFSQALEDLAVSMLLHNQEATDGDNWILTLTTRGKPDTEEILRRIAEASADGEAAGLNIAAEPPDITAELLPEKDWLQFVHDSFPPVRLGNFFIYGSHYEGSKPEGCIPLQIDAATAFGSGEHETTQGCLQALESLKREHDFKNGLDMGCGSGILAIALLKLWPEARVTAVDIDPESVAVTKRHAAMNAVSDKIQAEAGDGYQAPLVGKNAPYDIVTANILANPLIEMAPALANALKPGGYAILSGLLTRQKDSVVAAHEAEGLALVSAEAIGDWQALLLRK